MTTRSLAFAGSARKDSFNKKLVKIAVEGAKVAGAEVTYLKDESQQESILQLGSKLVNVTAKLK